MSAPQHPANWEIAYADMAAHAALDVIGRKITRTLPRSARHEQSQLRHTDTWQRHTLVATGREQANSLTDGAFKFLDRTLPRENTCLREAVVGHVRNVVAASIPHDVGELVAQIRRAGCLDDA